MTPNQRSEARLFANQLRRDGAGKAADLIERLCIEVERVNRGWFEVKHEFERAHAFACGETTPDPEHGFASCIGLTPDMMADAIVAEIAVLRAKVTAAQTRGVR